jgi:predicted flap endonuclease-1-like 5' DNA nuclease
MKHSKGKFKGEVTIDVTEKGRPAEKEEEPEPEIAGAANPEPENTKSKPKFKGGAGTKMDPFVITPSKGLDAGEEISSKQVITISGLKPGGVVNMEDLDSSKNGKRFAIVAEPDEVGRQSALVADDNGEIKFRINFKDDKPSYDGATYEGLLKMGTSSVYFTWAVEVLEDTSDDAKEEAKAREAELSAKEEKLKAKEAEIDSKQAELDRIAAKAETIDFGVIGTASASEKDDLKVIKGIGPFIEEKLNALGIYTFAQIAKMTSDLEDEVNVAIEFFPGRVKRDKWVKQAKELTK